jgi:hypothetical protein
MGTGFAACCEDAKMRDICPYQDFLTVPEERRLSEILNSAMDNLDNYNESGNTGFKLNYFIEINNFRSKLPKEDTRSYERNFLRDTLKQLTSDRTLENMQNKRLYWATLEILTECFDRGKIALSDAHKMSRFYPLLAEKMVQFAQ